MAAQVRQEAEAHVVGPVQILQHDHERTARGTRSDQAGDRLEEAQEVEPLVAWPRRVDFGQELRERGAVTRRQRAHQSAVTGRAVAQEVDPRAERQHLLGLVAPARRDVAAALEDALHELADEAALADPGVADHGDATRLRGPRRAQRLLERLELAGATDKRDVVDRPPPSVARLVL